MAKLSVYDPPMCCSTGVCGPDEDDQLAQFASALEWARKGGVEVERFELGHQPAAFATNAMVKGLLESDGMDCLPLVIVDGEVLMKGDYPTRDAMAARLGLTAANDDTVAEPETASSSCCGPADKTSEKSSCC